MTTPTAVTAQGRVAGRERKGVLLFAGIPFADPPIGPRRLQPPQPHPGWEGVRDATTFGRPAVQQGDALGGIGPAQAIDWSEDCLSLNVQTPAVDDGRRPVLVWVHGGAFVNGTGAIPWYDGTRFVANGDVVVVTVNYRLGVLGWLHLAHRDPSLADAGNCGLLDQVAALRWVHDNIAAFGGDPAAVTVLGESAGAMSVATLLATPAARGLFARAIAQSGAAESARPVADAEAVTDAILSALGTDDPEAVLAARPGELLRAQQQVVDEARRGRVPGRTQAAAALPFGPVVDGRSLPAPPLQAVAGGAAADVPLLLGTNRDEWTLFSASARPVTDGDDLRRRLARMAGLPATLVDDYARRRGDTTPQQLLDDIMTDAVFRQPAIRLAEAQSAHQPRTYMYLFEVASTAFGGRLGSCHALEIPFVFDNLDRPGVQLLTGPDPPQSVADAMHGAWLAFARRGDPGHPGVPGWPAYDTAGRATMGFGEPARLLHDPLADDRLVWASSWSARAPG